MAYNILYALADQEFDKRGFSKYQKATRPTIEQMEQEWADKYLQPIIDFMGYESIINEIVPSGTIVKIPGVPTKDLATRHPNSNILVFKGSTSGHWYSKRPDQKKYFDPYDTYQILGTNQFCQTFAIMNILNKLPTKSDHAGFKKYYDYTLAAIKFIETYVNRYGNVQLKKKIQVCKKHYKVCLNCLQISLNVL